MLSDDNDDESSLIPNVVNTHTSEPDMVAVYILLGCLAVSGLVILGIVVYCTAHCWRKKCFKGRQGIPAIRISPSAEDGYVALKHSRMNGQASVVTMKNGSAKTSLDYEQRYQVQEFEQWNTVYERPDPVPDVNPEEAEKLSVLHYDIGYCDKNRSGCFRGTLTFALRYDYIHRVLMVHLIRANHLTCKNRTESIDPYVKLYLLPERRYHCKTKILKKTVDPEFNEMFSFDVAYNMISSRMLQFTAYHFDRFTRHDLIGNIIMRDLFEKSDLYTWTEFTMQIVGNNEKDDFGDLFLYISYDTADAKLTVTVAKAYNLRPMDITGASDPYVKIIQVNGRKRVRTKKTTTKRANLHPVYNETLTFEMPSNLIDSTNLLIKVMDWDRIGSDDLLGSCVIGCESPTFEGREQWRMCITNQNNKAVGMWHSLLAEIPESFSHLTK